jgi:hypothetical protein
VRRAIGLKSFFHLSLNFVTNISQHKEFFSFSQRLWEGKEFLFFFPKTGPLWKQVSISRVLGRPLLQYLKQSSGYIGADNYTVIENVRT